VEREAVPPPVPVVKPVPQETPAIDVSKPAIIYDAPKEPAVLRKERPVPKNTSSEVNTSSTRRRRAPKRRIVDLATNDSPIPHPQPVDRYASHDGPAGLGIDNNYSISRPQNVLAESPMPPPPIPQSGTEVPRIDTNVAPHLPPLYASHDSPPSNTAWNENPDWDASGDLYRRKIEAIRDQVGNRYLSVLNEEGWDPSSRPPDYHNGEFGPASPIHGNPTTPRAASVQAIHSGRTLG